MALASTTIVKRSVFGDQRVVIADVTGPTAYATGGEELTPSTFGLSVITHVPDFGLRLTSDNTTYVQGSYDPPTGKVLFYEASSAPVLGVEVTASDSLDEYEARIMVIGH